MDVAVEVDVAATTIIARRRGIIELNIPQSNRVEFRADRRGVNSGGEGESR